MPELVPRRWPAWASCGEEPGPSGRYELRKVPAEYSVRVKLAAEDRHTCEDIDIAAFDCLRSVMSRQIYRIISYTNRGR